MIWLWHTYAKLFSFSNISIKKCRRMDNCEILIETSIFWSFFFIVSSENKWFFTTLWILSTLERILIYICTHWELCGCLHISTYHDMYFVLILTHSLIENIALQAHRNPRMLNYSRFLAILSFKMSFYTL